MDTKSRDTVADLLAKASKATDAAQAVNFAQAACNAANALRALVDVDRAVAPRDFSDIAIG